MSAATHPLPLPIEARRAAWDRLWGLLLAPPAPDAPPPDDGQKETAGSSPAVKEAR